MTELAAEPRSFVPGTTGWTASDLDDFRIEGEWFRGRYEIIEGVLTTIPAAYFDGHFAVENLIFLIKTHERAGGRQAAFAQEIDIIIGPRRVVRADAVYLTPDDRDCQTAAARREGRKDLARTRILVPPTLVIESISPGHEDHDEQLKREWYAEFGIKHYWILNAFNQSIQCLRLAGNRYEEEVAATRLETFSTSLFPGLRIELAEVWGNSESL